MTAPLDPSQDPDRFVPDAPGPTGPLDPALDPDRFDPAAAVQSSRTLPEMLGAGAYEEERDGLQWLFGLLGVLAVLALFTAVIYLR